MWKIINLIALIGAGFALALFSQHGGDRILNRVQGEQKALLERVQRYCYTKQGDSRTCRLYLREYTDYALTHEDQPVHAGLTETGSNFRASVDPQKARGLIRLKPLADVIDTIGSPSL